MTGRSPSRSRPGHRLAPSAARPASQLVQADSQTGSLGHQAGPQAGQCRLPGQPPRCCPTCHSRSVSQSVHVGPEAGPQAGLRRLQDRPVTAALALKRSNGHFFGVEYKSISTYPWTASSPTFKSTINASSSSFKISQSHRPNLLIFAGLKEKTKIYIFTKRFFISLSFT